MPKKFAFTFYLDAVAALLAIVGCVFAIISNLVAGQAFAHGIFVIIAAVVGVVASIAGTVLSLKFGEEHLLVVVLKYVAMLGVAITFAFIVRDRAELASRLFTWDPGNVAGWDAFRTSIVSAVASLISAIVFIVCSFFSKKTND